LIIIALAQIEEENLLSRGSTQKIGTKAGIAPENTKTDW